MVLRNVPLLLLFIFTGFASCKKTGSVTPQLKGKDLVLTPLDQLKVTADNAFTIKLFKNLDSANAGTANLFASPLSVSFALGMTSNGAAGSTLDAFKNTLNFAGLTQDQVNGYYNNLITNLPQLDPNTTLNIANSIWYRQTFPVEPQFLQTDSSYFHASVKALDFNDPASVGTINSWVNSKTDGKIPTIINSISADEVMFLINAIYFKSTWKEKFDPSNTQNRAFYLADGSQVSTSFMSGAVDFNFYNDATASVFELPYSNSKYSMVIVLPPTGTSVHTVAAGLDAAKWQTWMNGLKPTNNTITMPKLNFTYSMELKGALSTLGMGIAFTDSANFSLINPIYKPIKISSVLHKAYIKTDEDGTTAAAVTSVTVTAATATAPLPAINRPFIIAIREMSSGLILFAGTVNDPTQTGN